MTEIVTKAELKTLLGLSSSITAAEQGILDLVHPQANSKVTAHLGYDPCHRAATEFYPRRDVDGLMGRDEQLTVNAQHSSAIIESVLGIETLQLERLPLRAIPTVHVDAGGRFGAASGSFGSDSQWSYGDEFYAEWDEVNYCRSGLLIAVGAWPIEPGSVRVNYTAGYTAAEFNGSGNLFPDPSGIKRAVLLTAVKAFATWMSFTKKTHAGFTGGPLQSERMGDYGYTLASGGAGGGAATASGMVLALPAEAEDELEPFVHWGVDRL